MTSTINRLGWIVAGALALLVIAALTGVVSGGPLDPPAAPGPGGTQKGQISSLPISISSPGSYVVTRDLTGANGSTGIVVLADDVTIDLQGFTLRGTAVTGTGIAVNPGHSNVTIKNGAIRGWAKGVDAGGAVYSRVSGLTVFGGESLSPTNGIVLGAHSIIEDCIVSGFESAGIEASFVTIRDCVITDNDGAGIRTAEGSYVYDNLIRNNPDGVEISGSGLAPNQAFNYVRDNHLCWNDEGVDASIGGEGANVYADNTMGTQYGPPSVGANDLLSNMLGGTLHVDTFPMSNARMSCDRP